jgi:hypothetical protein
VHWFTTCDGTPIIMQGMGCPQHPARGGEQASPAVRGRAVAVRNVGMTQLLTEVVTTAIKKGMIEEILREPAQERAPPFQPENS